MKQHEEVIKVLEENGGWAILGFHNYNFIANPQPKILTR